MITAERRIEIARRAAVARWAAYVPHPPILGKNGQPVCRQRAYQIRCEQEGRCVGCRKPRLDGGPLECASCSVKRSRRMRERRERKRLERYRLASIFE